MESKIFKNIITSRLIIRPITLDDAKGYFEAEQASIKELIPHWSWASTDKSVEDIKKFISYALEYHEKEFPVEIYFSLLSKDSNKLLGVLWFFEINWLVPNFEILYWLDTRETGKGYMTEAVNALSRACFQVYDAKRVQIKISLDNEKSHAIPKNLGFKLEGQMENYFINLATNEVTNGLMYSCCHKENLAPLDIEIN